MAEKVKKASVQTTVSKDKVAGTMPSMARVPMKMSPRDMRKMARHIGRQSGRR